MFGSGAFVNPDFEGYADLYAKTGSLVVRVTMPKSPQAVGAAKDIALKALPRMQTLGAAAAIERCKENVMTGIKIRALEQNAKAPAP